MFVFQRTPNWLAPTLDYHADFPAGQRWLLNHVPYYSQWYRFWLFWRYAEGILPVGEGRPDVGRRRPLRQRGQRRAAPRSWACTSSLCFGDRPDLLAKVMPAYPPAAKRILRDNGVWATTLKRDNVELITDPIAAHRAVGRAAWPTAREHDVDVIIYATGFQASRFLTPMKVVGRGGVDLHAAVGRQRPRLPGHRGSRLPELLHALRPQHQHRRQRQHHLLLRVRGALRHAMPAPRARPRTRRAIDCRPAVHDAYNARIDDGNQLMAWGASSVNSWYKSESGRVAQNWPFSLLEFWQQTRDVDCTDYELI